MNTGDIEALRRLLGTVETSWLVARVRQRVRAAAGEPLTGVVVLAAPTPAQRSAVARLVGPPRRAAESLRVDLAVVEEALRRGPWPAGLADAVETLTGTVVDRRALRKEESAAWAAAGEILLPALARFSGVVDWWRSWCVAGGLKRTARAEANRRAVDPSPHVAAELVTSLRHVLAALPADSEPLAVLARRLLGDAHALDTSRPLGRLAQTAVAAAYEVEASASAREVWAAAGVVLSSVSSTVVCLGVSGTEAASGPQGVATATALEAMRRARMPVVLTLDQVRSGGIAPLPADGTVHVCENPTVVEVVADWWARSGSAAEPVLVCTYGQPSMAVVDLLRLLNRDGAECRYHGDFDWGGLRIAAVLAKHVEWSPWRFTAADYRAAIASGGPSRELTGPRAESTWDPELANVMAETGEVVEEEAVADILAADLVGNH